MDDCMAKRLNAVSIPSSMPGVLRVFRRRKHPQTGAGIANVRAIYGGRVLELVPSGLEVAEALDN
jgi:hypothetical protein